jgi:hypothetical protein
MTCNLFDYSMMFHLLTMFPINAAEQEKYYITNVLKKPQRVNVRQFVCQVELSTPTSLRCCASITAPMQMPAPKLRTIRSRRLS